MERSPAAARLRLLLTTARTAVARHKDILSLLVISLTCAPPLAAMRHFWDADVPEATGRMLAAHLFFFDAAVMILLAAVFTRRLTLPVFAAAFFLADKAEVRWLLDVVLHDLLDATGVFQWVFGAKPSDQIVNPRSAKLVLAAVLTPVLAIQVALARTRSVDRAFALMGTLAVALTTYLFHTALPEGVMPFAHKDARYIARYAAISDPQHAAAFCAYLGTRCLPVTGRTELAEQLRAAGLDRMASQLPAVPDGAVISTTTAAILTASNGRTTLKPLLVAFRAPKAGQQVILVLDEQQPKMIETVHERSFALLGIAAHGFWTLFVAALCALHQWRGRSRFFRANQPA